MCAGIVSITPIGSPIAGEDYSLGCSAGESMVIFEWMGPPDGRTAVIDSQSNINVISNSSASQLQFRPLEQSHSGTYLCRVAISGQSSSLVLNVTGKLIEQRHGIKNFNRISLAPKIFIEIVDSTGGAFPMAGQNYDIICGVHGAENLNSTITYQWTRNNETGSDNNSKSLSLTPVRISDAGTSYFCSATVVSNYLTGHSIGKVLSPRSKLIIKSELINYFTNLLLLLILIPA